MQNAIVSVTNSKKAVNGGELMQDGLSEHVNMDVGLGKPFP